MVERAFTCSGHPHSIGCTRKENEMQVRVVKVEKRERKSPMGWRPQDRREYNAKARMYFHPVGESIIENLMERRNRPVDLYRSVMPEVIAAAGLHPDTKVVWSQTAGCGCGCSPGFVVKDHSRFDVWVDVEMILNTGERAELAFARVEELAGSGTD